MVRAALVAALHHALIKDRVAPRSVGADENDQFGRIEIFDDYSTIELPEGMPKEVFRLLKKVWVSGRQLDISRMGTAPPPSVRTVPAARRRSPGG